jgi:elongation factor G
VKQYTPDKIRNIALVGHQDTGKTSLTEAILFSTGAINRIGRVEDGNTTMDTGPEEIERQISIQAALAFCEVDDYKINIIDTPGYEDFVGEVMSAVDVVEGAVVVVRGDAGTEVGTEKMWNYLRERNLPTLFCINKMDKEHASFDESVTSLRDHFGPKVLPVQLPLGDGPAFRGIVDLLTGKAYEFTQDGKGKSKAVDVPDDLKDRVSDMRREVFEAAAENDEALMDKYIETDSLSLDETMKGLAAGVAAGDLYPLFCTSAEMNIGTTQLLRGIAGTIPSPVDRPRATEEEKGELKADSSAGVAAKIFKNVSESHVGDMLFLRSYQGTLEGGRDIFNSTRDAADRLGQLFFLQGKHRFETDKIVGGDMGAAVKLKNAHVGDTLCDKAKQVRIPATVYPTPSM